MNYFRSIGSIYFLLSFFTIGFGQIDTTIRMPEVIVTARHQVAAIGQNQLRLDTASFLGSPSTPLGQVLGKLGAVHIKNYGLGRLATSSIRGGAAVHTAVLWNDIPLQSPLNGQVDFSLFPLHFFEETFVTYGANASLFGSGAVGGSIQLNSLNAAKPGFMARIIMEGGSFGQQWYGTLVQLATSKVTSKSRLFWQQAENNYAYRTFTGAQRKLPNAAQQQQGLLQSLGWKINEHQRMGLHLWWQAAERALPPSRVQATSEARQTDRIWRSLLEWQYTGSAVVWKIKTAWLQEGLDYHDPISKIESNNSSRNWSSFLQGQWALGSGQQLDFGSSIQQVGGKSTAFTFAPTQWLSALQATYLWKTQWHKPMHFRVSLRQEWQNDQRLPFIPQVGWEWQYSPQLVAKANVARHFRLPTFNDWYWSPGGNLDVQAEQGWSESLGASWSKQQKNWRFGIEQHLFHHQIKDWILWLPAEGGIWRPENKRLVQSYGLEHHASAHQTFFKWQTGLHLFYTYTRSINKRANGPNDASVGKQLLYIPVHQARLQGKVQYQQWALTIQQNYTGRSFTTQDASAFIPAFTLTDVHLAYTGRHKTFPWQVRLSTFNLWDHDYELVANQPLPGRYFQLGLQMELNQKNNSLCNSCE